MSALLLSIFVFGLVSLACFLPRWFRCDLSPFAAALFVSSYSFWHVDFLPFLWTEVDVGYFLVLAIWPLYGFMLKTGRTYLFWTTVIVTLFAYLTFFGVDALAKRKFAMVDFAGFICWLAGIAVFYLARPRVWSTPVFLVAAGAGAMADLFCYYLLAERAGLAPLQNAPSVYLANAAQILILVPVYTLPLLFVRQRADDSDWFRTAERITSDDLESDGFIIRR